MINGLCDLETTDFSHNSPDFFKTNKKLFINVVFSVGFHLGNFVKKSPKKMNRKEEEKDYNTTNKIDYSNTQWKEYRVKNCYRINSQVAEATKPTKQPLQGI